MKIFLFIILITSLVFAVPPWMIGNSKAEDIQIKLVTISPGDELTMWWGHNAVIVEDTQWKISRFYNYGLFSFDQDNFLFNFARGRLIFWVGDSETLKALSYYKSLKRNIRIQILNLPPSRRLEMARRLAINVLPQNRYYLYDHYMDNCATRVRDLIDEMVEGQFAEETQQLTNMTFRKHTRRFTYHNFFMDWLLIFLMSGSIDKPINKWQEMFLPTELEKYSENFKYDCDQDSIQPLISRSYIYYQTEERDPVPDIAPDNMFKGILFGSILAIIAVILTNLMIRRNHIIGFKRIFGYYNSLLGVLFGLPGFALFILCLFTDHSVTYYNVNLLLANPLTIMFIPLGMMYIYQNKFAEKWLPLIWHVHAFLAVVLLILKIFSVFYQDNWLIIVSILPVNITFSLCFIFLSKQ